jgi:hypothetical protein
MTLADIFLIPERAAKSVRRRSISAKSRAIMNLAIWGPLVSGMQFHPGINEGAIGQRDDYSIAGVNEEWGR